MNILSKRLWKWMATMCITARAIADGDLLILSNDAPSAAEQSNQQPENGLAGLGESQNAKKGK